MKLIGVNEVKKEVSNVTDKADIYRRGGVKPPHMIIFLAPGNGQTVVTDYVTDEFYEHKVRNFRSLSLSLEYRPDGSYAQAKEVIEDIYANADYTNAYEGIVAVDVSGFSDYMNEAHTAEFFEELGIVSMRATVIVFIDPGVKRAGNLREKAEAALETGIVIDVSPYTYQDFGDMVVENIKRKGVCLDDEKVQIELIRKGVEVICDINTAKDTVKIADKMISYADFTERVPFLGVEGIKSFFSDYSSKERGVMVPGKSS